MAPVELGFYWVRYKPNNELMIAQLTPLGWVIAGGFWSGEQLDVIKFGPRIIPPEGF